MNKFCHNCGKPYNLGVKFCPECGTNLASLGSAPPSAVHDKPPTVFAVGRDEDEDGSLAVDRMQHLNTNLRGLELDWVKDRNVSETVGAAVKEGLGLGVRPVVVERGGEYIGKDAQQKVMADLAREGGAIRPENRTITQKID